MLDVVLFEVFVGLGSRCAAVVVVVDGGRTDEAVQQAYICLLPRKVRPDP